MPDTPNPVQNEPRKVFRQRTALLGGGFVIAILAIAVVTYAVTRHDDGLTPIFWCVAIALLIWIVLIRPSVVLDQRGLHLHNLLRDVTIPWHHVDLLESRWNLKVFTPEGKGYSAWAISAQRPKGAAAATTGSIPLLGRRMPDPSTMELTERPGSAGDIASKVRVAREDYDRAVKRGAVEADHGPVVIRPAILPIVALVTAAVLIALALLT